MSKTKTTKGWYSSGDEGRAKSKQVDKETKEKRAQGFQRFWLENDSSAKITFLDNPDFFIYEHNLQLGGKWFNFYTCLKDFDTCPLCESGDKPSYAAVCSIIDHRKWTDGENNERSNEKKLFVARGKARQTLLRRLEEKHKGDMVGCVYELSRGTTKTESSTGEDFDYLDKKLTAKQMKAFIPKGLDEDWLKPYNYEERLAPKSADELRKIVGAPAPVGSEEESKKETKKEKEKEAEPEETASDEDVTSIEDLL